MVNPETIFPINNNCLVQLEERNEGRIIHLAGKRSISSARRGICLRPQDSANQDVLVAHGGIPVGNDEHLVLVPRCNFIRIGGSLQDPYIQITPEEVASAGRIALPETFFSGWYRVVDVFPNCELTINQRVLPIYGEPRLEMEDDSEYCSISAIGVVEC